MATYALRAHRFRSVTPRRFVWLLWLALLLPVGQLAAMCHALSHTGQETNRLAEREKGLPEAPCDLCLIGVAIGGGARGEPPPLPQPAVRHELPQAALADVGLPLAKRAYLSRAPPSLVPH